jgi:hypothetical protein
MAGLSSGTTDQTLSAKPWLDLRIQNVPKEQVAAVELHSPTRELRFLPQPATAAEGTDASQTSSAPPAPAWKLVAPELTYSVKPDVVEGRHLKLREPALAHPNLIVAAADNDVDAFLKC